MAWLSHPISWLWVIVFVLIFKSFTETFTNTVTTITSVTSLWSSPRIRPWSSTLIDSEHWLRVSIAHIVLCPHYNCDLIWINWLRSAIGLSLRCDSAYCIRESTPIIDHPILLERLSPWFGISFIALSWIKSYLLNRSFYVNNEKSSVFQLLYGVPQGSVLGPPPFILYTTPLSTVISSVIFQQTTNSVLMILNFSYHSQPWISIT